MERVIEKFKDETGAARIIADHLITRATVEETFVEKLLSEKKNMTECMSYVNAQARNVAKGSGEVCIEDDTVFGWATHYFDEEILVDWKPTKAKVTSSKSKVVEEDNDEDSDDTENEELGKDTRQKTTINKPKAVIVKTKIGAEQLSLFDM
jgi:hypothetical protein